MSPRLTSLLTGLGLTVAASLLLSDQARSDSTTATPAPTGAALVMASSGSCDGIRDLMVDTLVHQMVAGYGQHYNPYYQHRYRPVRPGRPMAKPSRAPTAARSQAPMPTVDASSSVGGGMAEPAGPSHHTTTNVQERGVDEADIVKTDGRYVYTLHANELVIAKTWPVAQTDVAARVTFKTIYPQKLYLRGNQVIVMGYAKDAQQGWNYGRTRVMTIDVKNRKAPRIRRIVDVEGHSQSSRVVGDDLYMVQTTHAQLPPRLTQLAQQTIAKIPRADQQSLRPWEVQSRLASYLRYTLKSNITMADLASALPRIHIGGVTRQMACRDLYIPRNNTQLGVTTLARISIDDNSRVDMVGAMVTGGTVYASTSSLYVAAQNYHWNTQGLAQYGTQVHQFSLGDERTRPAYVASGMVEGQLLNTFSMSEWRGDLRIATTDWNWGGQQGGNNLFVLRPHGRELRTIGALKGLAKGERIYSGRMMGDKGYLVTFRQTDPLFTLDLKNPYRPRVVGELKVNGFSSYIHPIGGDLLLTIGQDATSQGRVTGTHLQVFDVSNPARPFRKFHEKLSTTGYSYSAAQNDHHAFMYDPVTGTLAFPLVENSGTGKQFNGLAVYDLDRKRGFTDKGRIDHGALAEVFIDQQCETMKQQNPAGSTYYCSPQYRGQLRMQYPISRSMIVDNYILSLSQIGLEIHELGDLDVAATLSWAKVQKKAAIAQ